MRIGMLIRRIRTRNSIAGRRLCACAERWVATSLAVNRKPNPEPGSVEGDRIAFLSGLEKAD